MTYKYAFEEQAKWREVYGKCKTLEDVVKRAHIAKHYCGRFRSFKNLTNHPVNKR